MSQNYFIAIGIGQYKNGPGSLGESCKNDCGKMIDALKKFGFSPLKYKYFQDPQKSKAALQEKETILLDDEATLENITNLFENLEEQDEFRSDTPDIPNNLVIYYSGHGISGELFGAGNYFYWVPVDYPQGLGGKPARKNLYSWVNELLPALGNIRFQHLIFINDSCFSAGGLTVSNLVPQTNQLANSMRQEKRSVWALCSCAADELAYADEESSFFTTRLVDMMLAHKEDKLPVSMLCDLMNRVNDIDSQNFFCERLNVINDNFGHYDFELINEEKANKALQDLAIALKDGLPKYLNYEKEKKMLRKLSCDADAVLVFSNHRDSALPLMMRSANSDALFRAYGKELKIISESVINHEKDDLQKIFSFFNLTMAIKGPVASEEELVKKICARLKARDYFIGILLNEESRKNKNLHFVAHLVDVIAETHSQRKSGGHLYLFVLDEQLTDYTSLQLKNDARIISKLVTDKIAISSDDFDDWYVKHEQSITNNYLRDKYIKQILKEEIYVKIKNILKDENPPAFIITEICRNASCDNVAKILLTQIHD